MKQEAEIWEISEALSSHIKEVISINELSGNVFDVLDNLTNKINENDWSSARDTIKELIKNNYSLDTDIALVRVFHKLAGASSFPSKIKE